MASRTATLAAGLVLAAILEVALSSPLPAFKTQWRQATLDNFNAISGTTFRQRLLIVDEFFDQNAQDTFMLFYTGNEGNIESFYNNTGFAFELAKDLGALVVFGEHRFFGESLPSGDKSWDRPTIGYLSVEQALADFVQMIAEVKQQYGTPDLPVVAVGGSYGGMLSGWIRQKYPDAVTAAIASSAPTRMVQGEVDGKLFFEAVTDDFKNANPACVPQIRKAFDAFDKLAQSKQGRSKLKQQFNLCELKSDDDVTQLRLGAVNAFTTLAMMDYPYPTQFLAKLPAWPVNYACNLSLEANSPLEGLVRVFDLVYGGQKPLMETEASVEGNGCLPLQSVFVECADQTGCGVGSSGKSWDFLMCSEMSYTPFTNDRTDMFPPHAWNHQLLTSYCKRTWGVTPRFAWSKSALGTSASNVFWCNGLKDPWHVGGVLELSEEQKVQGNEIFIIPEGAHHLDLRGRHKGDPASVLEARKRITNFVSRNVARAWADLQIKSMPEQVIV